MEWDENIPRFERYPKINKEMRAEGECRTVKVVGEPAEISAETVEGAYLRKNITNITPKSCFMMVVDDNGEKKEFWFNETSYSVRRDLKKIKEANNGSLIDAVIQISRTAVNDPTKPNWKIEQASA